MLASAEGLEGRELLSGTTTGVQVVSVSTTDSMSVTVDYRVSDHALDEPLALGIYRSADATLDAGDRPVMNVALDPASLDANGSGVGAVGDHAVTIAIPGGLYPLPAQSYVVAAANPASALAGMRMRAKRRRSRRM